VLELDHVFICLGDEPHADVPLVDFGLDLSGRGVHPGQGTRSAAAFFDNAYLELLWGDNDAELQSERARPLCLWERVHWRETGACPFGISFRPIETGGVLPPIETWPYAAPFLPPGATIPVVTPPGSASEPLVFISLVSAAPARIAPAHRPPLVHAGRRRELTGVRLGLPRPEVVSSASRGVCALGPVQFVQSTVPHLELEWDRGAMGKRHDLGPTVPLSVRW
jgi:hypothetical protein